MRPPTARLRTTALVGLLAAGAAVAQEPELHAVRTDPPAGTGPAQAAAATPLDRLYRSGRSWAEFYAAAESRRELWTRNTERAAVPAGLLDRARAVPGEWRLLVVALDRCSDSAHTLPYLGRLVDLVPGLDLRIITPEQGRSILESHRTPDGRSATPTLLIIDAAGGEAGAWVERPAVLQAWMLENEPALGHDAAHLHKMAWYEDDAGRSTLADIVALLERAAAR